MGGGRNVKPCRPFVFHRNLQRHKAWEYHRYDELQARRSGFKRGAAYLTRYWIIIAYAAFSLRRIAAKGVSRPDCSRRAPGGETAEDLGSCCTLPAAALVDSQCSLPLNQNSSIPEGSSPRSMAARRRPLDLKMTFKEWLAQQPELQDIRRSILVNPTGALALVVPQQMPSTQVLQVC